MSNSFNEVRFRSEEPAEQIDPSPIGVPIASRSKKLIVGAEYASHRAREIKRQGHTDGVGQHRRQNRAGEAPVSITKRVNVQHLEVHERSSGKWINLRRV